MARLRETPERDAASSSANPCYSVIGIYGVAGSGKTTFARYIRDYIKEECKEEKLFDTIMCIHVTETFSVDDLFHEMLKDITGDRHSNISDHEELEKKLKEELCGKRFFLILDDIWVENKNDPQLLELKSPLDVGMKGSKILVTARTKYAVGAMCADEPIKMPDLDEDEYFSMFMHYALDGTCVAVEEFKSIGREIARKLHRSPIAAATVAGRLGINLDIRFWKNAAKLDMSSDTMGAIWWSYQLLNPDIRRCFEFCNIFPRRYELTNDELVRMWIAQGFIKTSCATEDMEDVAERYIQELVSCSFLQPKVYDYYIDCFAIHDLLHDLLDKVAGCHFFRIENERRQRGQGFSSKRKMRRKSWKGDVPRDVRHLFIQIYDRELITEKILGLKNLRTLIIYLVDGGSLLVEKIIDSICKRLPKLRVLAVTAIMQRPLCLAGWLDDYSYYPAFSVPKFIGQLKHLRYLAVTGSYAHVVILPGSLTELHHIQLLDFGNAKILEFTFADLTNLRHIICGGVRNFSNIGRLISLQTLPPFTLSNEHGYEIKQLRDLNKLCGSLVIYGLEYVKSKMEALEANLAAKEGLTELKLEWGGDDDTRCIPEVEAEVLEGLCPPMGLEKLCIQSHKGSRYPNWMVGKDAFIHLRVLFIGQCSWSALPGNMEHLTSLRKLKIERCLNIRSLPTLPWSLEVFHLSYCDAEFMKSCQTEGHPYCHKIKHIPEKYFGPAIFTEHHFSDSNDSEEL